DRMLDERPGEFGPVDRWAERWLPEGSGLFDELGWRDFELPSLPSLDLSLGEFGSSLGGLPAGEFWNVLEWTMWATLAIAGAVGLWFAWMKSQEHAEQRPTGWRLGPWPVDPANLASAAQLILAFEHLALSRLGPEAYAWNHRALARRLT